MFLVTFAFLFFPFALCFSALWFAPPRVATESLRRSPIAPFGHYEYLVDALEAARPIAQKTVALVLFRKLDNNSRKKGYSGLCLQSLSFPCSTQLSKDSSSSARIMVLFSLVSLVCLL